MFANSSRNSVEFKSFKKTKKKDSREVKAAKNIIGVLADSCFDINRSLFSFDKTSFDIIGFFDKGYKRKISDFLMKSPRWNRNTLGMFANIKKNTSLDHEDLEVIYGDEYKKKPQPGTSDPFWTIKRKYHSDKKYEAIHPLKHLFNRIEIHHGEKPEFLSSSASNRDINSLYALYWQMNNPLRGLVSYIEYYQEFYERYRNTDLFVEGFMTIMRRSWDGYSLYKRDLGKALFTSKQIEQIAGHKVSRQLSLNMEFCDDLYLDKERNHKISNYYTKKTKDKVVKLLQKKFVRLNFDNIELFCTRVRSTAIFYDVSEDTVLEALGLDSFILT